MLKVYSASPATSANFNLVPIVPADYVVVLSSVELCTPTAATVTFTLFNATSAVVGLSVYTTTSANETLSLDSIRVIPESYYMDVKSTQTNSVISAYGSYAPNI